MNKYVGLFALALGAGALFFLPSLGHSSSDDAQALYVARVNHVYDGDTLAVQDGHGYHHRIRLASIDAPELKQPWGIEARAYLATKINQRYVTVKLLTKDKYGREIANVFYHDEDINRHMVEKGLAWHYKDFDHNPEYGAVELESRKEHRGLWCSYKPMEPWVWREKYPNKWMNKEKS